jgi:hypothetical protein
LGEASLRAFEIRYVLNFIDDHKSRCTFDQRALNEIVGYPSLSMG